MSTHISILPVDVVDAIRMNLAGNCSLDSVRDRDSFRFLRIPHPRTGVPSLFLPYRSSLSDSVTLLEIQTISPTANRSWFMCSEVIADGKLLLMTPIDPVFLLIPILQAVLPVDASLGNFRTFDDIFEEASAKLASSPDMQSDVGDPSSSVSRSDLFSLGEMECIQGAMRRLCDVKDIGPDITVFRFSQSKLVDYLTKKVVRLSRLDFIEKSRTLIRELAKDGLLEDGKEDLLKIGCVKIACDLIAQYLPLGIYAELLGRYDFNNLNTYLQSIRDESLSSSVSGLQPTNSAGKPEDKEHGNKKRKASTQGSKGVEKLKKANINGMSKLSSFFKKPEVHT